MDGSSEKRLSFRRPVCNNIVIGCLRTAAPLYASEIEMSVKRSSPRARHNPFIVVPPAPLGPAELSLVRDALSDVAPEWSVDLDGPCREEATLILLPEGGDDAMGPSFVISRESFGFRLDQVHWDEMHEVGIYSALTDTVAAMQVRLTFSACQAAAPRLTLH